MSAIKCLLVRTFPRARTITTTISLQQLGQYQRNAHLPADPSIADVNSVRWSNKDLDPVLGPDKKWEWYHIAGFWVVEGFSVGQIQTASATVALGLNPGLALVAMFLGNVLVAVACAGVGFIGSKVFKLSVLQDMTL